MRIRLTLFTMAGCMSLVNLLVASSYAQPLLKVDFGLSGNPSPVQAGFTGVSGDVSETTHFENVGPYTVALDGQGFFSSGGGAANIAAGVRNLYRDYFYNNSTLNGEGIILGLGGFEANKIYDVTLWSYDSDQIFTPTPTSWSPFGDTSGTSGAIENFATPYPSSLANFSTTLQVATTTGLLELFGTTTGGSGGTRLNAVTVKDGETNLLALDFGRAGQPPSPTQATYTGIGGLVSDPVISQTVGALTVSLEGQGFFSTTSINADLIDPAVRDFHRDYYYNNSITPGEGIELTIDGVTPNTDYDLTLWSYDADNFSSTHTTWNPTGATTGTTGAITNIQEPYPLAIGEYSTKIRVRSTTASLQVFGTTTEGTGGTRLNGFELNVATAGVDGDYNDNGTVDAADYVVWRDNVGSTTTLPNDPTGGTIGQTQYNTWQTNFGLSSSGASVIAASVPEPAGLLIVLCVGAVTIRYTYRR